MDVYSIPFGKIPEIHWYPWNDLQTLKDRGFLIPSLQLTDYCLVFSPTHAKIFSAFFSFEKNKWFTSHHDNETSFEIFEISHWAFLPKEPMEWNLDFEDVLNKVDEWEILKNERVQLAKSILDNLR